MAHVTTSLNRMHLAQTAPAVVAKTKSRSRTASAATPDFRALFTSSSPAARPAAAPAAAASVAPAVAASTPAVSTEPPTPESVFGPNVWEANPLGRNPNGSLFSYNPLYFASANTAAQVAHMLGGTVIQSNALAPNAQQQPNLVVQMPDGRQINAGLVASFYSHGYPQSYVDNLIAAEINGTNT